MIDGCFAGPAPAPHCTRVPPLISARGGLRRLGAVRGGAALNLDRAVLEHRDQRANRRKHRRQNGADNASRERKLGHDAPLVLHDDAPDVAFVDQRLDLPMTFSPSALNESQTVF